ncbi:MAG: RICIN domain-containing protein [Myxococcales bacterium]|nr:RICIN domain-containing protein [Myxococcales bacterium]MCA9631671.1 RICIN domain-containing protein [Myxococcales bacterium]
MRIHTLTLSLASLVLASACTLDTDDTELQELEDVGTAIEAFAYAGQAGYHIVVATGYCLQDNGGTVTQEPCSYNNPKQNWVTRKTDLYRHEIRAAQSGRCLDIPGSSMINGADLQTYPCNNGLNQRFTVGPAPYSVPTDPWSTIRPAYNSFCLDIEYGTAAGQKLQQYYCLVQDNQEFRLTVGPTHLATITGNNCATNKVLEIDTGSDPVLYAGDELTVEILPSDQGDVQWYCYKSVDGITSTSVHHAQCPAATDLVSVKRQSSSSSFTITCYED